MKINSLLRIQQYFNHIGLLIVIISSVCCLSLGSGDIILLSKIPILPLSETNELIEFKKNECHQIVSINYNADKDTCTLQVNDCDISLYDLSLFLSYEGPPYRSRNRRYVIDFIVNKETPFKYVEKVFNELRRLDKRLILFRTTIIGEVGGATGVKILLPPADHLYFAAIEKKGISYLLPPVANLKMFYWKDIFDTTKVSLHIRVNEKGVLFYNNQKELSPKDLFARLKKDVLSFKSKKNICTWLQIDENASVQRYLEVYVTIKNVYKEIWDEFSLDYYGKPMGELEKEKRKLVRRSIPFSLLWMSKEEYQFLKKLKKKNQLDAFILESKEHSN